MQVRDKELKALLGEARFYSVTYRLFKLPDAIETLCEDYGQACKYKVGGARDGPAVVCCDRSAARSCSCSIAANSWHGVPLRVPSWQHVTSLRRASPQGTIPGHPHSYQLDDHHTFNVGKWYEVCGNSGAQAAARKLPGSCEAAAILVAMHAASQPCLPALFPLHRPCPAATLGDSWLCSPPRMS